MSTIHTITLELDEGKYEVEYLDSVEGIELQKVSRHSQIDNSLTETTVHPKLLVKIIQYIELDIETSNAELQEP